MTLAAGKLRRRITLRTGEETQDPDTGYFTPAGQVFVENIAASIEPLSTREFVASAATQTSVSTRIVIRFLEGVKATMEVEDDRGVRYTIEGPPLPDRESGLEYLTLMCNEVGS
jgi:SPP1 family predicted phage head-tail adaptor